MATPHSMKTITNVDFIHIKRLIPKKASQGDIIKIII